jgi:hypothetical protein
MASFGCCVVCGTHWGHGIVSVLVPLASGQMFLWTSAGGLSSVVESDHGSGPVGTCLEELLDRVRQPAFDASVADGSLTGHSLYKSKSAFGGVLLDDIPPHVQEVRAEARPGRLSVYGGQPATLIHHVRRPPPLAARADQRAAEPGTQKFLSGSAHYGGIPTPSVGRCPQPRSLASTLDRQIRNRPSSTMRLRDDIP